MKWKRGIIYCKGLINKYKIKQYLNLKTNMELILHFMIIYTDMAFNFLDESSFTHFLDSYNPYYEDFKIIRNWPHQLRFFVKHFRLKKSTMKKHEMKFNKTLFKIQKQWELQRISQTH